jgi:hypothetical protein
MVYPDKEILLNAKKRSYQAMRGCRGIVKVKGANLKRLCSCTIPTISHSGKGKSYGDNLNMSGGQREGARRREG